MHSKPVSFVPTLAESTRPSLDTTNVLCFYTDISVVDVHYHSCYQIVVSTRATFDSVIEEQPYHNLKGFIINKYTRHSCTAPEGSFLVYYIESRSLLGKQLKSALGPNNFINIERVLSAEQLAKLAADFSTKPPPAELRRLSDDVLGDILNSMVTPVASEATDHRIVSAVDYIHTHLHESIALDDVAQHIHLSPERTRHLFLEQIEIPISQYIVWKRIKAVLIAVIKEKQTFFEASLRYGFTDQSHFNRFFRRMFGISATVILKNSRFVQFVYPEV